MQQVEGLIKHNVKLICKNLICPKAFRFGLLMGVTAKKVLGKNPKISH